MGDVPDIIETVAEHLIDDARARQRRKRDEHLVPFGAASTGMWR